MLPTARNAAATTLGNGYLQISIFISVRGLVNSVAFEMELLLLAGQVLESFVGKQKLIINKLV